MHQSNEEEEETSFLLLPISASKKSTLMNDDIDSHCASARGIRFIRKGIVYFFFPFFFFPAVRLLSFYTRRMYRKGLRRRRPFTINRPFPSPLEVIKNL